QTHEADGSRGPGRRPEVDGRHGAGSSSRRDRLRPRLNPGRRDDFLIQPERHPRPTFSGELRRPRKATLPQAGTHLRLRPPSPHSATSGPRPPAGTAGPGPPRRPAGPPGRTSVAPTPRGPGGRGSKPFNPQRNARGGPPAVEADELFERNVSHELHRVACFW